MFKVNNKDTRTTPLASFWCLYCQLWTYFTSSSSVSIVNFEHLIAGWVITTNEAELDFHQQKLNARVAQRCKTCILRNNEIFGKYQS